MREVTTYYVEIDTGIVIARKGSTAYVPVLQYDRIGEGGDFTRQFEYEVEPFDILAVVCGPGVARISRNKVPRHVKDNFRREIARLRKGGEKA